jgi:hypothetical protein
MRITVFSPDMPFPANRGGRADIWRRILAFRQLGHEVMLVNLFEPAGATAPTDAQLKVVDGVVNARFSFPMRRSIWRTAGQLGMAWHTPWHAATRSPTSSESAQLDSALRRFQPQLLWLEGPWFGQVVRHFAQTLQCPFVYRSHNVEHQYLWRQAAVAVRLRDRLAWRLACIGVKHFEQQLMFEAAAVFDISMDDSKFWRSHGVKRQHWLPPLPELAVQSAPFHLISGDVVFVGNLGTPNNVRGVEFLVLKVFPLVRIRFPLVKLSIVGSNPSTHVRGLAVGAAGVELHADVVEPMQYLFGARVLVNPVMTGSGVQVKMLDMLMTDVPIVTTRQGTRGLPPDIAELMLVAETAEEFAAAICRALAAEPTGATAMRRQAREKFSNAAVAKALSLAGAEEIQKGMML